MTLGQLSLLLALIGCVSSETYYIVTSSKSHCPREFVGSPCLTLEQYASHSSSHHRLSHVTLMMESGNHLLQDTELRFGSYSWRINITIIIC